MNSEIDIVSTFDLFKNTLTVIPPSIAIIALLIYIRTGSMFVILDKIWSVFAAKNNTKSEEINAFNQEMLEIANFRFMYGIDVSGVEDIKSIHHFKKKFNIQIATFIAAKRYMHPNFGLLFKKPKPRMRKYVIAALTASFLILLGSSIIGLTQNIFIRINDSGNYYSVNKTEIIPLLFGDTLKIHDVCNKHSTANKPDIDVICALSADDASYSKYINDNLSAQKRIGITFFIIGLWVYISSIRSVIALNAATKICSNIKKHYTRQN